MFCTKCGASLVGRRNFCGQCGTAVETAAVTTQISRIKQPQVLPPAPQARAVVMVRQKSSGVAALLSFLWAGLGQIYTGQIAKGIILIVVYPLLVWTAIGSLIFGGLVAAGSDNANGAAAGGGLALFGFIALIGSGALWIYGMVNAYRTAERLNREQLQGL